MDIWDKLQLAANVHRDIGGQSALLETIQSAVQAGRKMSDALDVRDQLIEQVAAKAAEVERLRDKLNLQFNELINVVADKERAEAEERRLRKMTSCTMGVGDGGGRLFVHGDLNSIKAAQALVFRAEAAEAEAARLRKHVPVALRGEG